MMITMTSTIMTSHFVLLLLGIHAVLSPIILTPFPHQACSFTLTNGRLRMHHRSSYTGTLTQRYDDYAMKHLAGATSPTRHVAQHVTRVQACSSPSPLALRCSVSCTSRTKAGATPSPFPHL